MPPEWLGRPSNGPFCSSGRENRLKLSCDPPHDAAAQSVSQFEGRGHIQAETRISRDGEFCFKMLPPGEYGLKVGHDAYKDSEVPHPLSPEEWKNASEKKADPWQRAKVVNVTTGRETKDVELELPPPASMQSAEGK